MGGNVNKQYLSIKDLRDYLDKEESEWTDDIEDHFGKFEDQAILVDCFAIDDERKFRYKGVGHTRISKDLTMGYIIEPSDVEKLWRKKNNE